MGTIKISGLPPASTVSTADEVVLNQGGVTKRAAISLIVADAIQTPVLQVATFASIPVGSHGLYLVTADETKGGNPSMYFFTSTARYWFAMVQDS